ncbi:phosphatidylglycerol lysyltransferase domain-containing protein [Paenibacillus harenae]|uniref:Phosphatidylglycerol lysyltransferase n=1 Tax=Paenibacillus harenae TaxID=306543 RepID=A0ABT9TZ61_PAEHA|nr:phosphatidylglycerol lysyltransferase domain-containing protein [Paenibacillus harenae]MDQ0112667.1 phosphatidylglycerol lysyltransferase [Paenibacillus harenae]
MPVIHTEQKLLELIGRFGHNSHAHLYFLGDKQWFCNTDQEAFLAFRSIGNRYIVLGDPVGNPYALHKVIEQFVTYCRERRRTPVFYQTTSVYLPLYRRLGLQGMKIGQEARVELAPFHLNGKAWIKLRNRLNKFHRSGYSVMVKHPPYSNDLMFKLKAISDEWLRDRKEKSFSVSAFTPEYVSRFPVAILTDPDGNIAAFVTIAGDPPSVEPGFSEEDVSIRQITLDLMRYNNACPHGTMDFLFLSVMLWAKEQKYAICSLGVAPLANVCDSVIAKLIYTYGKKLYNFKGLYEYKNKFAPQWKDVYLVGAPATLPLTAVLLTLLIQSSCSGKPVLLTSPLKRLVSGRSLFRRI